jgi:hypothetical protein
MASFLNLIVVLPLILSQGPVKDANRVSWAPALVDQP